MKLEMNDVLVGRPLVYTTRMRPENKHVEKLAEDPSPNEVYPLRLVQEVRSQRLHDYR